MIAYNVVGDSPNSADGNGAIILTYPDAPVSLANDESLTTAFLIGLTWSEGSANGGTPVIDYRVSGAAAGTTDFSVLDEGVTTTSFGIATLTSGNSYIFKIEARNAFGYS